MSEKREYDDFESEFVLKGKDRCDLRKEVVNKFLSENKGYWKGDVKHVTRYKYYVETLNDGRRIFLLRPTFLNKGIDFQVWVEKFIDDKDKKPSHKSILNDLKEKKEEPIKYKELIILIKKVWNCEDPDEIIKNNKLKFDTGFSVEIILKILKWLFIEQDITYWNYDGRDMLMKGILEI